jgi:hypothetical protein
LIFSPAICENLGSLPKLISIISSMRRTVICSIGRK